MDTLSALVYQLGKKYLIFVPMVHKILLKYKISHQGYDLLCARIKQDGSSSDFEDGGLMRYPRRGGRYGIGNVLLFVILIFFLYARRLCTIV